MRDCVIWRPGEGPAQYQSEVAADLPIKRRVCVRSPHGVGKTAVVALIILWFALTNDGDTDWKVPITASAWRQLTKFLFPEVHKWSRKLRWDLIGRQPFNERLELQELNLKLDTGEAFCLASDNSALIEGAHADRILYVFDEAKEIPTETWDSAEGAFSSGDCYWLAVSTPGEPVGRFYDIQSRKAGYEDWAARHVTVDEAISAGRMNQDWVDRRLRQWGEKSAAYQNRVAGNFASSEADGVIPLRWVELAVERWYVWHDEHPELQFTCVGADIARSGDDATVLALRYGMVISDLRRTVLEDTMQTTGRIKGILDARGGYVVVDVIGIGAGVVDRLAEQNCSVRAFNASEHTDAKDSTHELGFVNLRAAGWWHVRELLDPANGWNVALPPDDTDDVLGSNLTGDLVSVHWKVVSGGKIQVEAKEDIKERIGRSTDDGDAVVMAFWEGPQPGVDQWINALKKANASKGLRPKALYGQPSGKFA
jgi:hypothetical protein